MSDQGPPMKVKAQSLGRSTLLEGTDTPPSKFVPAPEDPPQKLPAMRGVRGFHKFMFTEKKLLSTLVSSWLGKLAPTYYDYRDVFRPVWWPSYVDYPLVFPTTHFCKLEMTRGG